MASNAQNESMRRELDANKELVEKVMSKDERACNQDLWLCLQVWREQGIQIDIPEADLARMTTPETITRMRRHIQNTEGRMLPTDPNVLVERKFKQEAVQAYFKHKPGVVQAFTEKRFGIQ